MEPVEVEGELDDPIDDRQAPQRQQGRHQGHATIKSAPTAATSDGGRDPGHSQKAREELWPVLAESPARLLLHGIHLSSQMTPPAMFKKYITPHTKEMSEFLHKHNKVLAQHADNDTGRILGDLMEAGWDMQECFATDPLVPTTLKEARDAWGTDMIIFGGIPSIIMEEDFFTDEEFEEYMIDLFRTIAPGDAFILGVSDNVTAPAKLERVSRVTEMIEQYGKYPVSV